jgi:Txe/YoeB family toxin of Txe-Axe toxin-antitoxin module
MKLVAEYSIEFAEDLKSLSTEGAKLVEKVLHLVEAVLDSPFKGVGHPHAHRSIDNTASYTE